jgi:hypothetical protein
MQIFAAQCFLGGVLGFVGFTLTLVAAADEACAIIHHPEHGYEHLTLTRWPSTISELNSDWQSARGRLFFGFMLATAALLYVSRMPEQLDRLPFERRIHRNGEHVYVCCLADCGPGCEAAHIDLCSWLTSKLGGNRERASELQRSLTMQITPRHSDAMCCGDGHACNTINSLTNQARLVVVPLGIVFVALCPTNNYWTEAQPGSTVVKDVHLSAAALLFLGGTVVEAFRLYFLWCESRAAGIAARATHGLAPTDTSCRRFLREPVLTGDPNDDETATVAAEGIGPMRPWLMSLLVVGVIGAVWSCATEISLTEARMSVKRGDVALSPVGTAFCPQPQFDYAQVTSFVGMNETLQRLSVPFAASNQVVQVRVGTRR